VSRDEAAYLEDMVEACARVIEYTSGLDTPSVAFGLEQSVGSSHRVVSAESKLPSNGLALEYICDPTSGYRLS
jgi:hypothetical protein